MTAPEKTQGERWPVGSVWVTVHGSKYRVVAHDNDGHEDVVVVRKLSNGALVERSYEDWEAWLSALNATRADAAEGGKPPT